MQLSTLIHRQGGKCFYCRKNLPESEANIEHIIPNAMGDYQGFNNLVACCSMMNSLLQDLSPKYKIEILLNWNGKSPCPKDLYMHENEVAKNASNVLNTSFQDPLYGEGKGHDINHSIIEPLEGFDDESFKN